jgi:hypothetical protein
MKHLDPWNNPLDVLIEEACHPFSFAFYCHILSCQVGIEWRLYEKHSRVSILFFGKKAKPINPLHFYMPTHGEAKLPLFGLFRRSDMIPRGPFNRL